MNIAAFRVRVGINEKALSRCVAVIPGTIHAGIDVHRLSGISAETLTHIAGIRNHPHQGKSAL